MQTRYPFQVVYAHVCVLGGEMREEPGEGGAEKVDCLEGVSDSKFLAVVEM